MLKSINRASVLVLALAQFGNAQALADESGLVEQIIVTGARTPLDIHRLGSASTVISREDLNRQQARYLSDVLRTVPGFSVSQTGVRGTQTQVRVRGSEANHVLVLIDGVRANDPATGDEFRWEHLAASNIERIEIVRGAQSALWGSDAIGAVVHIITRSGADHQGLDIYAEHGTNNTLNVGVNGVALVGGWSVAAGVESLDTDGDNISRSGSESDGAELVTGSFFARYSWSEAASFNAGLRMIDASSDTDSVDFFVTGLPVDADLETRSNNLIADVGASWLAHDERVNYRLSARYFDSEHRNRVDGAEGSSTSSERVTLAFQSDLRLGDHGLSLAIEYEDTDFQQRGAIGFGDPNQNQNMQVFSAIAEFQYLKGEKLSWQLGGRFDNNSDFDDVFTGKASLVYQLSDKARLRASAGTGHKTPTFTERFGFFPAQFIGNPNLKPETSVSYELGFDMELFDAALEIQSSVFFQELEDEINGFVFDPATFLFTADNRKGSSERSGVELSANWHMSSRFSLAGTYTYTDSKEENALGVNVREVRRPRHAGSVSLNYLSENGKLNAFMSANYGGERTDVFFPPFPEPQQTIILSDYWLVDLTVNYQVTPAIALFVRSTNLFDENYEQVFGYQTLGRAAYLGLRVSFGQ